MVGADEAGIVVPPMDFDDVDAPQSLARSLR